MTRPTPTPDRPRIADADVIVVGSGSAGATAAIAAARIGASVVLIEKLPYLGGTAAALAGSAAGSPRDVPFRDLEARLISDGALLSMEQTAEPTHSA